MTNKFTKKVILGIFIVGISFFGTNVFAISSASSADQCNTVDNIGNGQFSNNPVGNTITQATVSNSHWFRNNIQALKGWYQYNSGQVTMSGDLDKIIDYKLNFYKKYDPAAGYNSKEAVWHLQNAFREAGCGQTTLDCKLGKQTSSKFFKDCHPSKLKCSNLSGSYNDPISIDPFTCGAGYKKVENGTGKDLCCEAVVPVAPKILVNNEDCSSGQTPKFDVSELNNQTLPAKVDYSNNGDIDLVAGNTGGITIGNGKIQSGSMRVNNKIIEFQIVPNGGIVTITVANGVMNISGTNTGIPGNNGQFEMSGCTTFPVDGVCEDGYVLCDNCCLPCDHPPETGNSCELWGSGYVFSGYCCVFDCKQGKICKTGEILDEANCKCVCDPAQTCCGVRLNTVVPFIGDCIELGDSTYLDGDTSKSTVTQLTAFPFLMMGLTKIAVTVVLIFSIIVVIASGLLMATGGISASGYNQGKKLLMNVIISLILLGCSGLILKLINPTFFGG